MKLFLTIVSLVHANRESKSAGDLSGFCISLDDSNEEVGDCRRCFYKSKFMVPCQRKSESIGSKVLCVQPGKPANICSTMKKMLNDLNEASTEICSSTELKTSNLEEHQRLREGILCSIRYQRTFVKHPLFEFFLLMTDYQTELRKLTIGSPNPCLKEELFLIDTLKERYKSELLRMLKIGVGHLELEQCQEQNHRPGQREIIVTVDEEGSVTEHIFIDELFLLDIPKFGGLTSADLTVNKHIDGAKKVFYVTTTKSKFETRIITEPFETDEAAKKCVRQLGIALDLAAQPPKWLLM